MTDSDFRHDQILRGINTRTKCHAFRRVRSFLENLRPVSLTDAKRQLGKAMPHIQVTTVTPGHIDTGMFEGAHSKLLPLIPTAAMVEAVWAGIKKNKALVARPRTVSLIPLLRALLGIRAWGWLSEVSGTNDFMAGHKAKRELPPKE